MNGRVLIIAGSDPSGGAGLQADVKTVTVLGGYAMAVVTAITVQNTTGVSRIEPVAADLVVDQIRACLDDIGADAVKIGMLPNAEVGRAVARVLRTVAAPVVLDPVLVATSGDSLADGGVPAMLLSELLPIARVATPNAPELAALTGADPITDEAALASAARCLVAMGARAVLAKGGHIGGDTVVDLLFDDAATSRFERRRLQTSSTHGTGCTLASALAAGLAQGMTLAAAARRSGDYVHEAIRTAPGLGRGAGPLNHCHSLGR